MWFLSLNASNTMDRTYEKQRSFMENENARKTYILPEKQQLKFQGHIIRKENLDNLSLTGLGKAGGNS